MIDMETKRLGGPAGNRPDTTGVMPPPGNGRLDQIRKELGKAFDKSLKLPGMMECEPHGSEEKRLTNYLAEEIEPYLKNVAIDRPVTVVVGGIDKSRQNPLNKLGGTEGLGNVAMEAHWKITRCAIAAVAKINGGEKAGMHLARVAPRSDEGVIVLRGEGLTDEIAVQFGEAWDMARQKMDLRTYTYTLELPNGSGTEAFRLDLEAFSEVLEHKKMVVSCKHALSRPILVTPHTERGFLLHEISVLENKEVEPFYGNLPESFKCGNDGLAEVRSPFRTNLLAKGVEKMSAGTFVEIKLRIPESDATALLKVAEHNRKGYAEVFSQHVGMRALNTFIGKPRANRVLTPITQAFGDIAAGHDIAVLPVTGGYMQYWLDLPPNNETAGLVKRAIERRIHSRDTDDIELPFEPAVSMIDATDAKLSELRARFILKSMDRGLYPSIVLENTDFLINFVENIKEPVQRQVYEQLALGQNGGRPLHDLDNIGMIKEVCATRRTIRDTEDFIWVLRKDESLPEKIKAKREELEKWLFEFSWEKIGRMRLRLAKAIEEIRAKREQELRRGLFRVVERNRE